MESSRRDHSPSDSRHRYRHEPDRPRERDRDRERERDRDRGRTDRDRHDSRKDRSLSPGARRSKREPSEDRFNPYHEEKSAEKKSAAIAAAAAAAERINAQIQAKLSGGLPPSDPHQGSSFNPASSTRPNDNADDSDFVKDIEINHLMNRYTLTKGQTQSMIKTETGADVTTRGRYYPDKSMATEKDPPLYLHVTSLTKEGLEKAVAIIEDLMAQDNKPAQPNYPPGQQSDAPPGNPGAIATAGPGSYGNDRPPFQREFRRRWIDERVPIGLDYLAGFNVRGQIVGPMGANVKHIQNETGCRVQIKGRGSQFIEQSTGRESDEPTFLHILGQDPAAIARAVELARDLVKSVTDSYNAFKANPRSQQRYNGGGNGYGGRNSGGGYGGSGGHNNFQGRNQQSPPPEGSVSPQAPSNQPDYTAYYAAVAAGQDPYAAYGGYEAYVQYYQQYYAQYYAQMQAQGGEGAAQPPVNPQQQQQPPSGSADGSQYSAVPPPAGL